MIRLLLSRDCIVARETQSYNYMIAHVMATTTSLKTTR